MTTTVLITGANRGIGRGLAVSLLARPNHTVIAAVRDPTSANTVSLKKGAAAVGSKVILVKVESRSHADPFEAVKKLQAQGVAVIDTVIANAGIAGAYARVEGINVDDSRMMLEVNALPVISLFQAVLPLLRQSRIPKFIAISSNAACVLDMKDTIPYEFGSYGLSKAALNYLVRRIHFENDWLIAFSINPGFTQTDMGNAGAKHFGMAEAIVPIDESVSGILQWVDKARKDSESGNFYSYDGLEMCF